MGAANWVTGPQRTRHTGPRPFSDQCFVTVHSLPCGVAYISAGIHSDCTANISADFYCWVKVIPFSSFLPSLLSPDVSSTSYSHRSRPLIQLGELGERCKLQRSPRQSPTRKHIFHFSVQNRIRFWWQWFCLFVSPVWGRGTPLPPCPFTSSFPLFYFFLFFHWLYLCSSFVHPFPFYQNSPTPFPGRRS